MTDKDLIERAAAASGITGDYYDDQNQPRIVKSVMRDFCGNSAFYVWAPLHDNDAAFVLAVNRRMLIDDIRSGYKEGHVVAVCDGLACYEPRKPDPCAAMRRAIVRAAAGDQQ